MSKYNKNPEAVSRLSPEQYRVTQRDGTERPFENAFWDNKEPGIYVDVVSGEPLFASVNKFDSSSGWPSFTEPLEPQNVVEKTAKSHGMTRIEVRSSQGAATLAMSSPMVQARQAACAAALIPRRCASFPLMSSRAPAMEATANSSILRRSSKEMTASTEPGRAAVAFQRGQEGNRRIGMSKPLENKLALVTGSSVELALPLLFGLQQRGPQSS
jgi:peptide-methionine (R)-S-oxide reductase